MYLNIITPCSRPENLKAIEESINIPKRNYRWIVVFDLEEIPKDCYLPKNAEYHCYKQWNSCVGHAQRNYGLNLIKKGHIYFNDDDTIIHPELWESIKYCKDMDFISFIQSDKNGAIRLTSETIDIGLVDSHNFIIKNITNKGILFEVNLYYADGVFAKACFEKSSKILYIPKVLSIYNSLR